MFNPRQPRDTGGQWVRLGRGDLEEMIDALVEPRAKNIAQNARADTHVIQRDIKARVLKGVKVAPVYHVKVEDAGHGRRRVQIQAKGEDGYARAIIPEHKHYGNVDVTRFRRGGVKEGDAVVNKEQFAETMHGPPAFDTAGVRANIREALPESQRSGVGVTDVAKKIAVKKRARARPADTDEVSVKAMHRQVEAAVAAKGVKRAQADRVKALVTRYPPGPERFNHAADFWDDFPAFIKREKPRRGRGIGKADVDALEAFMAWREGAGPVTAGESRKAAGHQPGMGPIGDGLLVQARAGQRGALRSLFAKHPKRAGESDYDYIVRVRGLERPLLAENRDLLEALRGVRRAAKEQRGVQNPGQRAAARARAGLGQQLPRENRFALSGKPLDPKDSQWLTGDIAEQKQIGGGLNDTWRGKIDGKTVFFKPVAGQDRDAHGQIHPGIPLGNDHGRERGAYLAGVAMGLDNIAPVLIRDVPGHGQCIVQGGVGKGPARDLGEPNGPQAAKDKRALALYDAVIGNMDRHAGNYTVDRNRDRIYAIDNGLAFAEASNNRGGWNHGFLAYYFNGSLTTEEMAMLTRIQNDDVLWRQLVEDAGLPIEAAVRARRRVRWMVRNKKFLKDARQLGGNRDLLDDIS